MTSEMKAHWEKVYQTKSPHEVSWTQAVPQTSLELILACEPALDASIIDIGGGDSLLVDHLLKQGFSKLTVLDISAKAIERAQTRLGDDAQKVHWIVSNILDFQPSTSYDLWHDRAAFHFLTTQPEINSYKRLVKENVLAHLCMGTFSKDGPSRCSGLDISQYDGDSLSFDGFEKLNCFQEKHTTPFDTEQDFLFCRFRKN